MTNRQHGTCTACCNTFLCNSLGCGDSGFGIQGSRGPLCYECEHIGNPEDCGTIRQCTIGQVCHITEFPLGNNDRFYSMGCKSKDVCSSSSSSLWTQDHPIIGRAAPTCSRCCDQDFCNLNCAEITHSQTPAMTLTALSPMPAAASRRPPVTLPPVQKTCFVCTGDSTPDTCEYQYEETQCDPPNNYCMNIITNSITGTRTVERKCTSFDDCYRNWWQGSSDEEMCQTYTPDASLTANFRCSFCCIGNKCNDNLKPPRETLYQDN
ncbi:hypothetical protein ACJMK2_038891 [Sinanodonta woodiana]|uniref:Sodefrin-like factor n=1 Tax=Sinanodonta woodiana TaxID=1069815 RepID=A0ABD3WB74_SINWO